MHQFSLFSMFKQGWPVMTVLLGMSIAYLAIFIDRLRLYWRVRADAVGFIHYVIRIIEQRDREAARAYCGKYRLPVARAAFAVLNARETREAREAAMTHAIEVDVHSLEKGVAVIGTVASLAPFVGLFGTVVGIIKAFNNIAATSGGGTEVVSAGIAEALVTTACGLIVAIPAVACYNYCVHRVKNLGRETELAVYELVAWLDRDASAAKPAARDRDLGGAAPRRTADPASLPL